MTAKGVGEPPPPSFRTLTSPQINSASTSVATPSVCVPLGDPPRVLRASSAASDFDIQSMVRLGWFTGVEKKIVGAAAAAAR